MDVGAAQLLSGWLSEHRHHGLGDRQIPEKAAIYDLGLLKSFGPEEVRKRFVFDDNLAAVCILAAARLADTEKTSLQELDEEDADFIMAHLRRIEKRVWRVLEHPRRWNAVTLLAQALMKNGLVGPEEAEAKIEAARAPRPRWR